MAREFVLQLSNRPGELAHLARSLAARWVDIRHIASAAHGETACVFLTTSDDDATREVLHGLGIPYVQGDTVFVDVDDVPGGLAAVTERLATAGVNIEGVLTLSRHDGKVEMAFAVDDAAKAREVLGTGSLVGAGS